MTRTYGVNGDAAFMTRIDEVTTQEQTWSFGQVVPTVLLILPIIGFIGKLQTSSVYLASLTRFQDAYSLEKQAQKNRSPRPDPAHNPAPSITEVADGPNSRTELMTKETAIEEIPVTTNVPFETILIKRLQSKPWYRYLQYLLYGLSVTFAAEVLYAFPFRAGVGNTTQYGSFVIELLELIAIDFGIMWLSCVIFLDHDLIYLWKSFMISRWLGKGPYREHTFSCLMVLLLITISPVVGHYLTPRVFF
jgi:hypothetical protein